MTFEDLKEISLLDFAQLGKEEIGYIRAKEQDDTGSPLKFEIMAADGQAIAEVDDRETALLAMEHFELEEVTLH
ncbi:MAG: DUF1150 family protein [Alphaproteobacteria bacterium]|nr:DUF1150 family protein [Alphaproteobacteria bacterium]